jgi:hypothetical protein
MEGLRHSRVCIASFVLGLASVVLTSLAFAVAFETRPSSWPEPNLAVLGAILLFFFGSLIVAVVALGLGIIGLRREGRKRVFAGLGTVFSAVVLGGWTTFYLVWAIFASCAP